MFTKDDNLKAVYSDDLSSFLSKINMHDAFKAGQIHCRYCNNTIDESTLYAFVPVGDCIEVCCNQPQCILSLAEEAQK